MMSMPFLFLFFLTSSVNQNEDVDRYLQALGQTNGLDTKYLLIVTLNENYYVDNHWVDQFINTKDGVEELTVVIVERDLHLAKYLVKNEKLNIIYDDQNLLYQYDFYDGASMLIEKQAVNKYAQTRLTMQNAYQLKVALYQKIQ
jgi:hypothetical protein